MAGRDSMAAGGKHGGLNLEDQAEKVNWRWHEFSPQIPFPIAYFWYQSCTSQISPEQSNQLGTKCLNALV